MEMPFAAAAPSVRLSRSFPASVLLPVCFYVCYSVCCLSLCRSVCQCVSVSASVCFCLLSTSDFACGCVSRASLHETEANQQTVAGVCCPPQPRDPKLLPTKRKRLEEQHERRHSVAAAPGETTERRFAPSPRCSKQSAEETGRQTHAGWAVAHTRSSRLTKKIEGTLKTTAKSHMNVANPPTAISPVLKCGVSINSNKETEAAAAARTQ